VKMKTSSKNFSKFWYLLDS